jgi:rhodanese-related sulfurtransferase
LFFVLAVASVAMAVKKPTPTKLVGGKIITAEEVNALGGREGVYIFDMRKALNYGKGHIPIAISVPYKWTGKGDVETRSGEFDRSRIPPDKKAKIIFHSDGPTGWKSYKAATTLIKEGYRNIMWYRGGYADWTAKGYSVQH